ncbi:RNA ligase family protein [Hydrogenoanaerobacterium sp.]|uniref:ATP-dependent DNA ligase n=1 Tax=Hydrogenoanaerobacterium sp. TaxID=2953763 RepID=UPI00289B75AA|nr:RNA ligase family protein [Hydrogenoanaerobacterium sp.]
MDIFDEKNIKPMLIGVMQDAFDNPDYIYELKLDGERCIAYLDKDSTELRNKRNVKMLSKVPELSAIHKNVRARCILDGELIVIKDGRPSFAEIQRRSLMSNAFKIKLASDKYPANFTAYDILYYKDKQVTDLPLMERKKLLQKVIKEENDRFAISRFIEEKGVALYQLAEQQKLEGVVAKRKGSKYYFDKRTKDWIKIKWLLDDDFIVCGYILKEAGKISLVIAQYRDGTLIYKGHVTSGVTTRHVDILSQLKRLNAPPLEVPPGNERAVWVEPKQVCVVQWMPRDNGGLNQSVFKGFRDDKLPEDCIDAGSDTAK